MAYGEARASPRLRPTRDGDRSPMDQQVLDQPAPRPSADTAPEHVDVLIVGAGLSGIGAACHLEQDCPGKSYAILDPQSWPEDLDYAGKRVVVIGSGATAVTLVPSLSEKAEHVTMLQRTPSYVVSLPGRDPLAVALRKRLSARRAYPIVRWKNVL